MTPLKFQVGKESAPESQTETAANAEFNTLVAGQLEATSSLRERVKALETDSKHYATKDDLSKLKVWMVTRFAGALLSIVIALVVAFVRSSFD